MSIHLERCGHPACGRLFEVEQFSLAFGPGMRSGLIECPHCRWHTSGNPYKVYLSRKIAEALEAWPADSISSSC